MTPSKPSSEELDKLFPTWFEKKEVAFTGRLPITEGERQRIYVVPYSMFKAALRQYVDKEVLKGRRELLNDLIRKAVKYTEDGLADGLDPWVVPVVRLNTELKKENS